MPPIVTPEPERKPDQQETSKPSAEFGPLLRAMAIAAGYGWRRAARAALVYTSQVECGESDRTQFIYASEALALVMGATRARLSDVSNTAESDEANGRLAISVRAAAAEMRRAARLLTLGADEFERVARALDANPDDID